MQKEASIIIWGVGNYFENIKDRISKTFNVKCFCDSDIHKIGSKIYFDGHSYTCIAPNEINKIKEPYVLIVTESSKTFEKISRQLDEWNIEYEHINQVIKKSQRIWEKAEIKKYDEKFKDIREDFDKDKIVRLITVSVPVQTCNLRCEYCYIGQSGGFSERLVVYPSARFIRKALSRKRLGGTAFLNFCGAGETLLCNELVEIIGELLEEGHYISIVTNGLLTKQLLAILNKNPKFNDHVFFKCSLHYLELKKHNLLNQYAENIQIIREKNASFTVELVPQDEIIPLIPEIKKYCEMNFGALPHITVARDESKANMPILSSLNECEYKKIWGQFNSNLFNIKMETRSKRDEYCLAGLGTFMVELDTGKLSQCPGYGYFYNIYSCIFEDIKTEIVGCNCKNMYCRNAHVYLTLGMIGEFNKYTYFDVRDRVDKNGEHWINNKMKNIMEQRICDNIGDIVL